MRFPVKGGIERITIVMSEVNNQDLQQDLQRRKHGRTVGGFSKTKQVIKNALFRLITWLERTLWYNHALL